MKMKAKVLQNQGRTTHYLGQPVDGMLVPTAQLPSASHVEIRPEDGAYYLIRFDSTGNYCGDTWHLSLEEAQSQAEFEFGIMSGGWEVDGE